MLSQTIVSPTTVKVKRNPPDWVHVSVWYSAAMRQMYVSFYTISTAPDGEQIHRNRTYTATQSSVRRLASLAYDLSDKRGYRLTPNQADHCLGWNLSYLGEAS